MPSSAASFAGDCGGGAAAGGAAGEEGAGAGAAPASRASRSRRGALRVEGCLATGGVLVNQ